MNGSMVLAQQVHHFPKVRSFFGWGPEFWDVPTTICAISPPLNFDLEGLIGSHGTMTQISFLDDGSEPTWLSSVAFWKP